MKISYLITVHNETKTLGKLLYQIGVSKPDGDEVVILDDNSTEEETKRLLKEFNSPMQGWVVYSHALDNNYGAHKNFGIEHCTGDFIFQIDGDELPPETLLSENLHSILESNPSMEAFAVPRINDFQGVTPQHATQWGWRLTESPTYKRPIVNFPDYQFRIFKRDYPRISFLRRLHEKIEGYNSYVCLPPEEDYALYHDKTIEIQVKTNIRYNEMFTQEENKGHGVFNK